MLEDIALMRSLPNMQVFAPIDAVTGQARKAFAKVDGVVYACVPDNSGGWYIGGYFARVGRWLRESF